MSNFDGYKHKEYCLVNFVRNDMKFVSHDGKALVRDNFYIISSKVDKMFMFALLNNYYTFDNVGARYYGT